jgi:hypothetical protein
MYCKLKLLHLRYGYIKSFMNMALKEVPPFLCLSCVPRVRRRPGLKPRAVSFVFVVYTIFLHVPIICFLSAIRFQIILTFVTSRGTAFQSFAWKTALKVCVIWFCLCSDSCPRSVRPSVRPSVHSPPRWAILTFPLHNVLQPLHSCRSLASDLSPACL